MELFLKERFMKDSIAAMNEERGESRGFFYSEDGIKEGRATEFLSVVCD